MTLSFSSTPTATCGHVFSAVYRWYSFAILHQLRSIMRFVPSTVYQTLVVTLMLSRLDYGQRYLGWSPAYLVYRLQSVLNAAARTIACLCRSDHITDTRQLSLAIRTPE